MKDCRMCEYYHTNVCNHCDNQVIYSESPLIKGIRTDEKRKILKWITSTNHITCDEGEWYVYDTEVQEWHHTEVEELLELYEEQIEEGAEND